MALPHRKETIPVANIHSCASGCGCNTCNALRTTGCGCHSCGCNTCSTLRSTGCNNCNSCNNCGCNSCATVRTGCNCFGVLRSISGPFNRCGTCTNRNFPFFTGPCGPVHPCCDCCDPCDRCGCNNCGCNSCGTAHSGCGCNTCNNCATLRSTGCGCGCNSCGTARSGCGCNNCATLRSTGCGCGCNNCGCNNCCCDDCDCDCDCCCDDCCDGCDGCHASASFASGTPVELASGDSVTLNPSFSNSDDFNATQDGIELLRGGTYLIVYTVHVPANNAVSSRFVLTLNGERITASALDVSTEGDCTTDGFTMHAMVNAPAGSVLKLVSLNPVSICQSSASNVFTLSLTRIP